METIAVMSVLTGDKANTNIALCIKIVFWGLLKKRVINIASAEVDIRPHSSSL